MREISDYVKKSVHREDHILHEYLDMQQLCDVSTAFTKSWKKHLDDVWSCLGLSKIKKGVICDNKWNMDVSSAVTRVKSKGRKPTVKFTIVGWKVVATVIWDELSTIFINNLEKRKTANIDYYVWCYWCDWRKKCRKNSPKI